MMRPAERERGHSVALYDEIGRTYGAMRRSDPRIASAIEAALGDAVTVVNVGAGTGSYESAERTVWAVEPSEVMVRQRPAGAAPCLRAWAEALPLATNSVDAAMAVLTIHHWTDPERGLAELARVARKRVVLLTFVPDAEPLWLTEDYFPEIRAMDSGIFPTTAVLTAMLERLVGQVTVTPVPMPFDCLDGSMGAYWRRPEAYLRAEVRSAISSFAKFDAEPGLQRLRDDLASGRWARRYGHLLARETMDLGYRLFACEIAPGLRPS